MLNVTESVLSGIFCFSTYRSHRREGETEEEYQRRKRHHQRRKHGQHHHHKRRHHNKENDDNRDNRNRQDKDDDVRIADDDMKRIVQVKANNYSMYGSDDSFSDSDSEISGQEAGATENELNSSMNKGQSRSKNSPFETESS